MANFHTDEWIMKQLNRHYEEAKLRYPEDRIIGIFIQGSQNYGLDYSGSDIDTKCILTPTWEDICFNRKPVSTTHILDNEEHLDAKDIRLYIETFRKQNLNFLEILFTKYKILNPMYQEQWMRLVDANEDIAQYNPFRAVKTMKGIAMEKYHAMKHPYPSKLSILAQYSYDPKQAHHLLRVEEYLKRYIKGESYADCLISKQSEYLKSVKEGLYNIEEAEKIAAASLERATKLADEFCNGQPDRPDAKVDELFASVQEKIMRIAITKELNK